MTAHRRLIASLGAAWQKLIEPVGMAPEAAAQFARGLATHGVADVGPKTSRLSRFYKAVGVKEADDKGGYQITLDGYVLKTPARQPLTVPSKALARAIAAEWAWQARRVEPSTMPLMSLAATAIDQPQPRQVIEDTMVHYVSTDPVVCRVEPGELADKQAAALDPILQWVRGEIGATVEPSDSIFGVQLSPEDQAKFKKYLEGLDRWELAAAEQLAASCKSVCVALAAIKGRVGVQELLKLSRLEEDHQIEQWGLVEGGHDIDIADMRVRVAAPSVFLRLIKNYR